MKKVLVMALTLLLLTGCSAEYSLHLDKNFLERTYLYEKNDIIENLETYDMYESDEHYIEGYVYELTKFEKDFDVEREELSGDENSGYRYSKIYKYDKMDKESMIYDCYDNIDVSYKGNIMIKTSDQFKCFDKYSLLDDVTVKIYYNGPLVNTNADNYSNGVYTWKIDKENYSNKPIYLEVERKKRNHTFEIISGIVFILLCGVVYLLYYKKNNKK